MNQIFPQYNHESEFEDLFICLNSRLRVGMKETTTLSQFKKTLRRDNFHKNTNIFGDIKGIYLHANWEDNKFVPYKLRVHDGDNNKIYGTCIFCHKKSIELLQFENEDPQNTKERKKRIDKWNGFSDYSIDDYYDDAKEICYECLSTTFQNYIIDAFNIVNNQ